MTKTHGHKHGPHCGHQGIQHSGHVDYLQDGHLQHPEASGCSEHVIPVSGKNPNQCTYDHPAPGHAEGHKHGKDCGHAAIPHGDHMDYLVDGHLHHSHGDHCDDHGEVQLSK